MTGLLTEWRTPPLTERQWPDVLSAVLEVLEAGGGESAELIHGWSHSDFDQSPEFEALQWQPQQVNTAELLPLLHERARLGFCLGRNDLFLTLPDGTEVKFCHEGHLHLRTPDEEFAALLSRRLAAEGVALLRRPATLSP